MRLKNQLSALTGTALAMTLAAGSIGCLQSAFDLTIQNPVPLWGTVFLFAVVYSQFLQWKHGRLIFACGLALTAGYLLRYGTAAHAAKQLLQHLSIVYDRAYHWGVLPFGEVPPEAAMDLPLGIWAVCIALAAVRTVGLQKHCWLPVLLALVPLAACTVVTDTVPDEIYVFLLLAGLILLILPASVRRENPLQGIRLTAAAAVPVILGLSILFRAIPEEGYVNRSAIIQENIRTAMEHLPQLLEDGLEASAASLRGKPARTVDLSRLGDRIPFTYPVMEVTSEKGGTLYLRGQDYDLYDGLGWTASEDREETFFRSEGISSRVTVQTRRSQQQQYLPYYPGNETILAGGYANNAGKQDSYTIDCRMLPLNWRLTASGKSAVQTGIAPVPADQQPDIAALAPYLALPETSRQEARRLMEGSISDNAQNTEKADLIAAMVVNSARYDLNPDKMPDGQPDFALWFLQEAENGYCIHFATAATVLLRAADVPARYVTGYMTEAIAGETVTVTEEDAHAWAEYYEPRLGCWIPLEATPAAQEQAITPSPTPAATIPAVAVTEPPLPETVPSTAPSESYVLPEHSTAPTEEPGNVLLLALFLPVLALILAVQRSVRLHLRRKRQRTGTINAQALHRWREAERLARLLKETPAEELIELAQKAKYSQHELTAEELQRFDSYCRSCLRRLKEKPLYRQLIYRYVYAVY